MLTPIELCSRALLKVGAHTITSFDDGTVEAEVAASLYQTVRDGLLSAHPWSFATDKSTLVLDQRTGDFPLPVDCIRVLSVDTGIIPYRIRGRRVETDAPDPITTTYIARPDELDFPPFFDLALIAQLAAEFCIPLTDSTTRWEGLHKIADVELRRAKLIDAQEDAA